MAGWINLDCRALPGIDIVRDVLRGLPFSDASLSEIHSENFLEHIPQAEAIWLMNEMHRVLEPGGRAVHIVPMAGTTVYWQDPTHLSHWVPETLTYFEKDNARNRYYGDAIRPWLVDRCEEISTNRVLRIELRKP